MQLLDGYKSGGGLLFLSDDREIERDNLWGIRGILAMVFLNAVLFGGGGTGTASSGGGWMIGLLVALAGLYWAALRLFSSPETQQDTTTNVARV